jgi:DNA polymerase-1
LYADDHGVRRRAERQGINHCIQGTAAEIMKIGMINMAEAFQATPYRMILTVHDEVVTVCPQGEEEACRDLVIASMGDVQIGGRPIISVPLMVECGSGQRWSECKH